MYEVLFLLTAFLEIDDNVDLAQKHMDHQEKAMESLKKGILNMWPVFFITHWAWLSLSYSRTQIREKRRWPIVKVKISILHENLDNRSETVVFESQGRLFAIFVYRL